MKCNKCLTEIVDNAKFCSQCGYSQTNIEDLRQRCLADVKECEQAVRADGSSRAYIRQNFDNRLVEWTQAAELGIREAQWLLARCYDEGFGIERSNISAINWHLKAAEQGYPPAQNHLGSCYQNGDGVPKDDAEAVKWYHRAAEQDYVSAKANIGWCYDTGSGVAQDEDEATKWYCDAAEQGDYTSQFNLGVHYEWGSGVEQDKQEAIKWYRKAADQGYEKAIKALERLISEVAAEQKNKEEKDKAAEERFRKACREVLAEGTLSLYDSDILRVLGESLKISEQLRKQFFEREKKIFLQVQKAQPSKGTEVKFRIACKNAISDGKVTPEEEKQLKSLAKFSKMSNKVMKQIFADEIKIYRQGRNQTASEKVILQFSKACKKALVDGEVTPEEEKQLKSLAKFLKIPKETMKQIFAHEAKLYQKTHQS